MSSPAQPREQPPERLRAALVELKDDEPAQSKLDLGRFGLGLASKVYAGVKLGRC